MIERDELLDYEIGAAFWWIQYIRFRWLLALIASLYAWKVAVKYDRYKRFLKETGN